MEHSTALRERRSAPRKRLGFGVLVETEDDRRHVFGHDVSETGMLVHCEDTLPFWRSAQVSVRFVLPGRPQPLRVSGTIVRVVHSNGRRGALGIRFHQVRPTVARALRTYVFVGDARVREYAD